MQNHITNHLREAIALNCARRTLYAKTTGNCSKKVSNALIFSEYISLPFAYMLDRKCRKFRKFGVNILGDEIISMGRAPDYVASVDIGEDFPSAYISPNFRVLDEFLTMPSLCDEGDFATVNKRAKVELAQYQHPYCHAMYRHLLESIVRATHLAPIHARNAAQLNLAPQDAFKISARFIHIHIRGLKYAAWLDKKAFPIQQTGIPIIANEMPHVPEFDC